MESKGIPSRISCHKCKFFTQLLSRDVSFRMEVSQTCFTVTGKEIPQLSQLKQGKHSTDSRVRKSPLTMHKHFIDSSVRKSPLTMHKHSIDTSVSKSPLTLHSINPESVSKSPLTKEKILEVYADVFEGLGTFPGEPCRFRLKENYMPARHAPRKVPVLYKKISMQKYVILSSKVYQKRWNILMNG